MIGHVQKGMLIEDFLPAASEAKQPANKSGKPILITHSIGQLLQQIRNEWGKTRGHSIISGHPSRPLPCAFVGICGLSAAQL